MDDWGYRVYGVIRCERGRDVAAELGEMLEGIAYRDVAALVRRERFTLPEPSAEAAQRHHRIVEGAMRHGAVLPAPFGLVFREPEAVRRFLEEQYLALDDALDLLGGHWEIRVSVTAGDGPRVDRRLTFLVEKFEESLTSLSDGAISLEERPGTVCHRAFLVERDHWIEFVERAAALEAENPALEADVTGPWPPYDFVRFLPPEDRVTPR